MFNRKRDALDNNKRKVLSLYTSGMTDADIAAEMEVTRAAVTDWRRRNDMPVNSRRGRVYATWHHLAQLLLSKGWTVNAVAERVGQKRNTVRDTLRRMRKK